MSTVKAEVAQMLNSLPEESSFEDIQYHLYVREKIEHGQKRAEIEGTISHEQAKQRLDKWLSY